jgi:Protein of unknown function (DUF4197)
MLQAHKIKPFLLLILFFCFSSQAITLKDLTNQDANAGVKAALEKGANSAVTKLGVENGFLNNEKVKIKLPAKFDKVRTVLSLAGKAKKIDDLELAMNRAAETAVPLAKPLLVDAIKKMTLTDAKNILSGGNTSITDFFRAKTSEALSAKFLPIVKNVTDNAKLAKKYNSIMLQAQNFGVVTPEEASVEAFVTSKTTAGLYAMIAEEEKLIREDPAAAGNKIITKVFSALGKQ